MTVFCFNLLFFLPMLFLETTWPGCCSEAETLDVHWEVTVWIKSVVSLYCPLSWWAQCLRCLCPSHGLLVAAWQLAFPLHLSTLPAKLLWHCFAVHLGSIFPHGSCAVIVMAFNS